MSEQERPQHAITNAVTNETTFVPYSDAEWDELKAKQVRVQAELADQEAAEAAAKVQADSDKETIAARPTDAEISKGTRVADLQALMLKQNAVIDIILKKLGLAE